MTRGPDDQVLLSDPEWWRKQVQRAGSEDRTVYVRLSMNIIGDYQIRAEYFLDTPGGEPAWVQNHTTLQRARNVMVGRGDARVDQLGPGARPLP